MQFSKFVAIIAILGVGLQANAYTDGSLRRGYTVAQNDTTAVSESQPTQGVVILNTNTNTNSASNAAKANAQQSQTATQIPTTVVEANPVSESRAEAMRRARQNAELQTEQKIVEKLEESRLREENERAERLFGNKLEGSAASATATAVATPDGAAAAATATAVAAPVAPVVVEPVKEEQPTVNIEKVEIITPVKEEAPVAETKMVLEEPKQEGKDKFYVSPMLGVPSYNASNVKSNYALGLALGTILKNDKIALEGTFLYSNHSVDTFWMHPIYKNLDQYDFSAAAKYYVFPGPLRPYAGVSMTYIYRQYSDRVQDNTNPGWQVNPYSQSEESHAVNVGLLAGADFALNENVMIGAGMDWNFNIMSKADINYSSYSLPSNSKPLEEIDYYTLKINAKISF
jgi:hypothetical protein